MRLPWLRAPLAALTGAQRSLVTVVVAVVTGLVVAFIAAGTMFHVSASGSAAVQYVNAKRCPDDSGVLVERADRGFFVGRAIDTGLGPMAGPLRESAGRHGFDLVRRTQYGTRLPMTAGGRTVEGRLVARDGAQEHVRPVAGGGTDGVWVPSELAQHHGLDVGDELVLGTEPQPLRLPVAAVYPTITDPVDDFWCSQRGEVVKLLVVPEGQIKPPVIIVSPVLMERLVDAGLPIQVDRLQVTSGRPPASRDEADRHVAATAAFRADVDALQRQLAAGDHDFGGRLRARAASVLDRAEYPAISGERAQRAVGGSLLPLTGVSLLVGLAGVVGLARQWVQRRFAEVRLLWVRGASPAALGGKAVLELAAPLAVGAALGWLAARLSVPALAPAGQLDAWAPSAGAYAAGVAWLACLAVLAGAATLRVRREFQPRGRRRLRGVLRLLPWELAAAGLAVLSWRRLSGGALVVSSGDLLPRVDVLALMFPLLCLAVLMGVATRLAGLALRFEHRLRRWRWPALLWAARRAAAQHRLVVSLLAVAGLAVGVVAVGVGISHTERQAVLDKGRLFVGADSAVRLLNSVPDRGEVPAALRGSATQVAVRDDVIGVKRWRVLVIDPATAADGMPWRTQWGRGQSLHELTARLGPAGPDGLVPALAVGSVDPAQLQRDGLPPVKVVATVDAFPVIEHADGMLVIAWDAIAGGTLPRFTRYVLTSGDAATAVRELEAAGEPTGLVYTAHGANDALPFLVVAWTFDFFVLLGAVLAAVAAASLLVAIEARRRATAVAHALLARMGLRTRSLYVSYLAELGGLAVAATAVGLFGGWLVLAVASARLDPAPWLSPTPVPASLLPLAATVAISAAAAVLLVAAVAVRAAMRAPVRELLRG